MKVIPCLLASTLILGLHSGVAQDHPPPSLRWQEGAPDSISTVKDEAKVEGLKGETIHVFVSIADLKDTEYNRVWVQVVNHGKRQADFNPQLAVLVNTEKDKIVRAEAPEKAANSIQKLGEAKAQELSGSHCNYMAAVQCSPTDTQFRMSKQIATFSSAQAEWVRNNAMKQKMLAPNEQIQGSIIFKKDKKKADYILRIPVGPETFEFPLSAQNKPPSYD
jgi:hypothetical protein